MDNELDMGTCRNFVEVVRRRAVISPDRFAFRFLGDGDKADVIWTYGELERRAREVGAFLEGRVAPGDCVLLCYPPGLEFLAGFFGCLFAGVVAVPVYPPRKNRSIERLWGILADAAPRLVLTTSEMIDQIVVKFADTSWLQNPPWVSSDRLTAGIEDDWRAPAVNGDSPAFLQYTSGSTGVPKGVMVSHANLLANQQQIRECFQFDEQGPPVVSWLPVYHDMGLVGNVLQPLYTGIPVIQLSPLAVLQRPLRWIEAISRFRAHTSGAPNFAYDLCLQRIKPEQRDGLDLSGWKLAFVGAERVRPDTLEAFAEFFAPCGFRSSSFLPCYGLAEATLFVTGDFGVTSLEISPECLQKGEVESGEPGTGLRLVGSGRPSPGVDLRIVEPESLRPLSECRVGEVWVRGPQVAGGFWKNPAATEEAFGARLADGTGPYLRTGDLGFIREGQLFITGRIKDLIILDGRNHYPQDIEWSVERSHPGLRPGSCAAFAIEGACGERLVVVQEVERGWLRQGREPIVRAIRRCVAEQHETSVHDVLLVRPNAVPRTSSGKIQRSFCRGLYIEGKLDSMLETSRSESD